MLKELFKKIFKGRANLHNYVYVDGHHVAVGKYRPLKPDFRASHEVSLSEPQCKPKP